MRRVPVPRAHLGQQACRAKALRCCAEACCAGVPAQQLPCCGDGPGARATHRPPFAECAIRR
eukprot:295981-Alexandrium_andersonii.AAC.1